MYTILMNVICIREYKEHLEIKKPVKAATKTGFSEVDRAATLLPSVTLDR
jgi:hypothetical protein